MSLSFDTLAAANKYTHDSLAGAGAVAGVPCQIQSITAITGGNRVTFLWVDNNGDSHTSTMDVLNGTQGDPGEKGDTGLGIKSMAINAQAHLIITYDNDITEDAGEVPNVQADWNESVETADSFIKNKPTLGSAAAKNYTTNVRPGNHDLVESNAVFAAIDSALTSVYTPHGDLTCAELTADLLIAANVGNVYTMTDSGTTSALFVNGAGITISANDSVGIIRAGADSIMFNYMGNVLDLHAYQKKELTTPLTIGGQSQTEVEGALGGLNTSKVDKVSNATDGNFAGLDANGNLTNSGKKASDFATAQGLADEAATRSAMGAKNLFNNNMTSETIADEVTFTVNADKTVTAQITTTLTAGRNIHGTMTIPAGTYIYSGCPSGGSGSTYQMTFYSNTDQRNLATDRGEGAEFTIDKTHFVYVYLDLKVGLTPQTLLFKPMVRLATDANDTYRPYVPANKDLLSNKDNAILGARNILFHSGTYTTQGVRFESDDDGVITVTRQSASTNHAYYSNGRFTLKPGTYIFSNGYDSLPSGIQATYLYNHTDGVYFTNCNNGPKTFTLTEEKRLAFNIEVQSSQSPSGVKIYPMIRLATDDDKTFSPITMTNKELTKIGTLKTITVTVNSDFATDGTLLLPSIYIGRGYWLCAYQPIHIKAGIDISSLISGHANVITFPSGYTSGPSVKAYHFVNDDTQKGMFQLANRWGNGGIQFYSIDSELNTYIKESSADLYMATPTSFIMLRETT